MAKTSEKATSKKNEVMDGMAEKATEKAIAEKATAEKTVAYKIPDEFYEVLMKELSKEFEQHYRYFGSAQEVSFFIRKSQEYMRNVVKRMKKYVEDAE